MKHRVDVNNIVLPISTILHCNIAQLIIGLLLDIMKVDIFADIEDVVCRVNCWLQDQRHKLFYNKIRALRRH